MPAGAEALRSEIHLVAEGVAVVDEKIDRRTAELDEKIERTTAETHALIKYSYSDLDRRVRALEES